MDDETIEPPNPRVILIAGGFTGIVAPGECGCRLDDLMPCGVSSFYRDGATGIPKGCQPGYVHNDPRGGPDWVVSTKNEPPQVCPVCGGEWHAEDCDFGKEVALRLKAERDAHRMQFALHRLWPALERAMSGLVFTADRAGEVQADMNTLREYSKTQEQAPGCKTPAGCSENGCLGWCDEHRPEARAGVEDLQREVARLKVENARLAEETMRLQRMLNAAHQIVGELARPSGI